MPRSAPGPTTRLSSSSTLPLLGWSSPATMRSKVLLPQPEGPRMVMKSFSATSRSVACSASVSPCWEVKRRDTPLIERMVDMVLLAQLRPREQAAVRLLEPHVAHQPDQAADDDAEDDLIGGEQRLAVRDHVADAAGGADEFRDDHIGPGPAEHHAQRLGDLRRGARDQNAADQAAVVDAQRVRR